MLADYAGTDGHRLRRVEHMAQATRELAALVRAQTALVEARTAASKELWVVLAEHWPGAAVVFQKLVSQVTLAFLSDYPTPQAAALSGEDRMRQCLPWTQLPWRQVSNRAPQGRRRRPGGVMITEERYYEIGDGYLAGPLGPRARDLI